ETDFLTLFDALNLTFKRDPELQSFLWHIKVRQGEAQQAHTLPNPEFGIGVENILGEDENRSFKTAETTLRLSQLFELGGKRKHRIRLADLEQELAAWDLEDARLNRIAMTSKAFFTTLTAQAKVKLARENLKLSQKVFNTVKLMVQAGKAAPIAKNRALITVNQNRIVLKKEQHNLTATRQQLAACWGADEPHFSSVNGNLEELNAPPALAILLQRLRQNPELARQTAELELKEKQLDLAQAYGVPDMTLEGGIKRREESDDYTFLFGVSWALPVFDRNLGAIQAAQAKTNIGKKRELSTSIKLKSKLKQSYELLLAAYEETDSLRNSILPTAEDNFSAVSYGYRQGQFQFLAVLETQKTLFAIRKQVIDSLAEFHEQRLNIEKLTGQELALSPNPLSKTIASKEDK
ncbi:TolC family protein, partial [bacterium]|nr:TolC family protein [bacterium]